MLNNTVLIGRITKDLELKQAGETSVLRFTLAVNRDFKKEGQPEADFINCVAFNKTAEVINQYCQKGSQIGIEGSIQTGSYEKHDGTKIYTTDIIVKQMHFLESKKESNNNYKGYQPSEADKMFLDQKLNNQSQVTRDELPF